MASNIEKYAIYFENVTYKKNDQSIIIGITGGFPKNKITAIVGPSGSGKTSVLSLCNGLNKPSSGNIYINGEHIDTFNPLNLRRQVGLAFQDAKMINGTSKENLALPLTLQQKQLTEKEAKRLLQLVGLDLNILSLHVRDLSGGERQRLALARTLVNKPNILLLDEITSSLDKHSIKEIEQLVISINREHSTSIVWITHDLGQAQKVADYVWIVINGQLYESGSISVLQQPQNEIAKQFVQGEYT